jgi:hypothetical protein
MAIERVRPGNPEDLRRLWKTLAQLLAEYGPEEFFGVFSAVLLTQAEGLRLAGATGESRCLEKLVKHLDAFEDELFPDDYPHPNWPFGPPT